MAQKVDINNAGKPAGRRPSATRDVKSMSDDELAEFIAASKPLPDVSGRPTTRADLKPLTARGTAKTVPFDEDNYWQKNKRPFPNHNVAMARPVRNRGDRIAVFVDLDNTGASLDNIIEIFSSLAGRGDIVYGKFYGYGDDRVDMFEEFIAEHRIETTGLQRLRQNGVSVVDIRLVVDALRITSENQFDAVFVWAGVGDLIPLFSQLKDMGTQTITVDIPQFDTQNKFVDTKLRLFSKHEMHVEPIARPRTGRAAPTPQQQQRDTLVLPDLATGPIPVLPKKGEQFPPPQTQEEDSDEIPEGADMSHLGAPLQLPGESDDDYIARLAAEMFSSEELVNSMKEFGTAVAPTRTIEPTAEQPAPTPAPAPVPAAAPIPAPAPAPMPAAPAPVPLPPPPQNLMPAAPADDFDFGELATMSDVGTPVATYTSATAAPSAPASVAPPADAVTDDFDFGATDDFGGDDFDFGELVDVSNAPNTASPYGDGFKETVAYDPNEKPFVAPPTLVEQYVENVSDFAPPSSFAGAGAQGTD
ncbi:MAG: NYN domain-containing protein [Firmicutes bacterium]|nr:NYN domain-containing protein [Bacillota bacterium]